MSEHLFLLLNPLILRSSLLLSELWSDNLRKTKRRFTKKNKKKNAQSPPEPGCSGLIENGRALAIISPSLPHDNYKTQCSPLSRRVALKGIRLDLEWKAAAQNVSTVTKKKSDLSGNISEMPHLSQEEAAEQAGHTRYVWDLHWEGGEIAVAIENRSNRPATQEVKSNVEAFFFWKIKVILRQSLSVFHCLSRTPPRAITFGKAPSVVKMFDRAFI